MSQCRLYHFPLIAAACWLLCHGTWLINHKMCWLHSCVMAAEISKLAWIWWCEKFHKRPTLFSVMLCVCRSVQRKQHSPHRLSSRLCDTVGYEADHIHVNQFWLLLHFIWEITLHLPLLFISESSPLLTWKIGWPTHFSFKDFFCWLRAALWPIDESVWGTPFLHTHNTPSRVWLWRPLLSLCSLWENVSHV